MFACLILICLFVYLLEGLALKLIYCFCFVYSVCFFGSFFVCMIVCLMCFIPFLFVLLVCFCLFC